MTVVDWIIVAFTLLMGAWGYAQGLIVGALSLAGFLGGAFLGSRLGPLVLSGGAHSPYAPLVALIGAFLIGGVLASGLEVLGFRLRRRLPAGLGVLDGVGGALLIAAAGLLVCWIAGAVALQTPGARGLRKDIQRSAILKVLNDELPPSGPILNALARFDPFPQIAGPAPGVPPPTSKVARDPDVKRAGRSTVKVLGTACGLGVEGSGWVAKPGVVVTNAHVVAGETDTTVQVQGTGTPYPAQAIWFDSTNDVAILRVEQIAGRAEPLPMDVNSKPGTPAAILGFPENGPFDVQPARLGQTTVVRTQDAYGRGPVMRKITSLRGKVRSGNSGGPVVDSRGRVLTTIFAASLGRGVRTGFGVPDSIVASALRQARGAVGTGPCAH
jgi:Trypsin-like peptidase domain/Colicin V production protein